MADNDGDWLVGFDEDDDDQHESDSKRRAGQRQDEPDVQYVLARALLESVVGIKGIERIRRHQSFCLVVEAPGADWVFPVQRMLKQTADWDYQQAKASSRRVPFSDEETTARQIISAITAGGRAFGVSQSPREMLSPAMVAAADMHVVLPQPSNHVIAAVIKAITGKPVKAMPHAVAAGLGFDEIAGCIRHGSTSAQCVERLLRALSSKRSTETIGDDVPPVEALHGYGDGVMTWALNLIEDLKAWRRGDLDLSAVDRNVVLWSSPGLGKTSFVRSLAKSTGLPLVASSVAQWFLNSSGNLDGVIKECDRVFGSARALAPAILFLDELDGLPNRATLDSRNADWWAPVVGHVLTTLDGATSSPASQLIVIGATNFPEKLDAAVIRPGRLNRAIEIPMPDEKALEGIFRQHLGPDLPDADLSEAARLGTGNSGAQVVGWVKSARRKARAAGRPMLMTDLLEVIAPPDGRSDDLIRRVSIHESGHAVLAHVLRTGTVKAVSVIGSGNVGGYVHFENDGSYQTRRELEYVAMQQLGGRAAEEVMLGEPGSGAGGNSASDLAAATRTVALIHLGLGLGDSLIYQGDAEDAPNVLARSARMAAVVDAHLRQLYSGAIEVVRAQRSLVETIAAELIERRFIGGARFRAIVENHRNPSATKEISNG